ncbi:MAG TPA: DUF3037 domain-containing protein [Thermoleophilaceae bacterium]|nr:DUF3037 domain-containing protein [Thermoleophilaceae bacterium]
MPAEPRSPFQYTLLRAVPELERGECLNAGVILFARTLHYLAARVELDEERLLTLAPQADPKRVGDHLQALARVAAGEAGAGPIARLPPSERFNWLAAPSSTVVQPSAVHTGLCTDPEATLDRLFARLVRR